MKIQYFINFLLINIYINIIQVFQLAYTLNGDDLTFRQQNARDHYLLILFLLCLLSLVFFNF